MNFFQKHKTPRQIPTTILVKPDKIKNDCFMVFVATSKTKVTNVLFGLPLEDFHLEIDLYRPINKTESEITCKYQRTII